jgi:hypothetical protein
MAGGAAKAFGWLFVALGVLLVLGGAFAAGYAFFDAAQHPQLVATDAKVRDFDNALILGGAIAAGAGLLPLLAGTLLVVAGRRKAQETPPPMEAPAEPLPVEPAFVDAAPPRSRVGNTILGLFGLVLLVGAVVVLALRLV